MFFGADAILEALEAGAPTPPPPVARAEDRIQVVEAMAPYVARVVGEGHRPQVVLRHMLGLFAGQRGGRAYRRVLSTEGPRAGSGAEVLARAVGALVEAQGGAITSSPASISSASAQVAS